MYSQARHSEALKEENVGHVRYEQIVQHKSTMLASAFKFDASKLSESICGRVLANIDYSKALSKVTTTSLAQNILVLPSRRNWQSSHTCSNKDTLTPAEQSMHHYRRRVSSSQHCRWLSGICKRLCTSSRGAKMR